jgi:peptide/nickel transport system substrate-binding protein
VEGQWESYWQRFGRQRLSRRRTLAAGTGLALFVAGCGKSGKSTAGPAASSAPPSGQVRTGIAGTGTPKSGGLLTVWDNNDPPTFDLYVNYNGTTAFHNSIVYSKLARWKNGPGIGPSEFHPELDVAEKVEQPDPVTYVFRLRQNAVFEDKPPVNGRQLTSDDILYTWQNYAAKHTNRVLVAPSVDTVTAPDKFTVVFKLKSPLAPFLLYQAHHGGPYIYPRELQESGGSNTVMNGTGPFSLASYQTGQSLLYKRNPKYFKSGLPYLDSLNVALVTDESAMVAALRTQKIDLTPGTRYVPAGDAEGLAKSVPNSFLLQFPAAGQRAVTMDLTRKEFQDVRVRQAVSMALDRKALLGIYAPGKGNWSTAIPPIAPWWLDPQSAAFGPNAKFYQRNVAEAKKLLAAAGLANGLDNVPFYTTKAYGENRYSEAEVIKENLADIGIKVNIVVQEFAAYYSTTFVGKYKDGMGHNTIIAATEPDEVMTLLYRPDSARTPVPGREILGQDTQLQDMITKQRQATDEQERLKQVQEIQRYYSEKLYMVPLIAEPAYIFQQPYVRDFFYKSTFAPGTEFDTVWLAKS